MKKVKTAVIPVAGYGTRFLPYTKEKKVNEVKAEVTTALEKGIDVLAPSCGIAPKSPLANIQAFVEARDEFYQ